MNLALIAILCWTLNPISELANQEPPKPQSTLTSDAASLQLLNAIKSGDLSAVKSAIAVGAQLNPANTSMTPLIAAVQGGDLNILRLLVERGANPNHFSNTHNSPIWTADYLSKARNLTWNKNTKQFDTGEPESPIVQHLIAMALKGIQNPPSVATIRQQIAKEIDAKVGTGDGVVIHLYSVRPDSWVRGAIRVSCNVIAGDAAKKFIIISADGVASEQDNTASTFIPLQGSNTRDILLEPPPTRKDPWVTRIIDRIPIEQTSMILEMIDRGAELNKASSGIFWGYPLLAACLIQDSRLFTLLIEKGANPEIVGPSGVTPLQLCSKWGFTKGVEAMVKMNPKIAAQASGGPSPLLSAAMNGHTEVVRLLLVSGANVGETNEVSWSALHFAAGRGYADMVTLLLKNGANKEMKTKEGYTPLDLAKLAELPAIISLLQTPNTGPRK